VTSNASASRKVAGKYKMQFIYTPNDPPFSTETARDQGKKSSFGKKTSSNPKEHKIKMERALREMALGEYTAKAAWQLIRSSLHTDGLLFVKDIIDALFNVAIHHHVSTANIDETREWYDISWKIAGFIDEDLPREAGRLEAIGDILRTKAKIAESSVSAEEAMQQKYVPQILSITSYHGNKAQRKFIAKELNITEQILSRIFLTMQDAGLIVREQYGDDAIFSLTELGEKFVQQTKSSTNG